jgi:O-antigen/teichoic acid export membrane protein
MSGDDASRFHKLLTGGAFLFVGLVAELGISLLSKIIIARYLGKVDYGGVALGVTMIAMANTVVLAGLHTGVARFLPRFDNEADRHSIIWSAFAIVGGFSLALSVALLLLAPTLAKSVFHDRTLTPIFVVCILGIPAAAIMRVSIGVSQGYQETLPKVFTRNISFPVVRFLAIAIVIIFGFGSPGIAGAYVIAYGFAACLGFAYVVRNTDFSVSVPEQFRASELLSFSAPLLLTSALTLVLSDFDTFMIGYFASQGEVGVYNVIYPIAVLLLAFLRSFRFLFLPEISELDASENYRSMRKQYHLVTKWIFMTTTPVFALIVVYPELLIQALFGTEYVTGARALAILAVGFYVHSVLGLNGTTLTSIGRTQIILYDNIVAAAVNIGLKFWLIPRYGLVGAALATTASYVLINVLYSAQLYQHRSILPTTKWVVLTIGLAMVLVRVWIAMKEILQYTLESTVLLSIIFAASYIAVIVKVLGIGKEERKLVHRLKSTLGIAE